MICSMSGCTRSIPNDGGYTNDRTPGARYCSQRCVLGSDPLDVALEREDMTVIAIHRATAEGESIERVTDDIIAMIEHSESLSMGMPLRSDAVTCSRFRHTDPSGGPGDPWHASAWGQQASGQTCEMALHDLRDKIKGRIAEMIEREEQRLADARVQVEGLKKHLAK